MADMTLLRDAPPASAGAKDVLSWLALSGAVQHLPCDDRLCVEAGGEISQPRTQRLQNPLIKEYPLICNRNPNMI